MSTRFSGHINRGEKNHAFFLACTDGKTSVLVFLTCMSAQVIDITNSLPVNKVYIPHTFKYITLIYFEKTNNSKNKQAAKIS